MAFMDWMKGGGGSGKEPPKPPEPPKVAAPAPQAAQEPKGKLPHEATPEVRAEAKAAVEQLQKATAHLYTPQPTPKPDSAPVDTNEGMRQKAVNTDKVAAPGSPTTGGEALTAKEGQKKDTPAKEPDKPPPSPPRAPNPPPRSRGMSR